MCTIAQALEDRGIQKGMQQGMQQGIQQGMQKGSVKAMYSLVKDNIITPDIAAEELNVSVQELEKMFEQYGFTD